MAAARVLTSTSEVAALGPVGKWNPGGPPMTDIDPRAEISIGRSYDVNQDHDKDHLVVSIALAERVDREWIRWYLRLARVKGISARAEDLPEGAAAGWIFPATVRPTGSAGCWIQHGPFSGNPGRRRGTRRPSAKQGTQPPGGGP